MSVYDEVLQKLEELLEVVKPLPQGYQYKVRELSACIETVVSMYDDIQKGIIPEIFQKIDSTEITEEVFEEIPEEHIKEIDEEIPCAIIENTNEKSLSLGSFDLD